jgi:uncharacterized membrane protein YfcA
MGAGWTEVAALLAAFVIAVLATPEGISGAVLLLYRYWRQGQSGGRLALVLIAGTLPGVIAGSVIRVELLPSAHLFDFVVAAVLVPLGAWLALTGPPSTDDQEQPARVIPLAALVLLAAVAGCVGGIYGIGGGSILAPILLAAGRPPRTSHPLPWRPPS